MNTLSSVTKKTVHAINIYSISQTGFFKSVQLVKKKKITITHVNVSTELQNYYCWYWKGQVKTMQSKEGVCFLATSQEKATVVNLLTICQNIISAGALWCSKSYFSGWVKESYSNTTPLSCQITGYSPITRTFWLKTNESNSNLIVETQT